MEKKYKNRQEAILDHKENYRSRGWEKGKFKDDGPDKLRIRRLLDPIKSGSICLDIGCNDGGLGYILRGRQAVVYGVDVVDELVNLAAEKGVIAKVCPVEEIGYPDSYFDAVIMAEVLEHCFDPKEALKQVHRVVAEDGIFVGSVPHPDGFLGRQHHNGGDYHQQIFETDQLKEILSQYFKKVKITPTPYLESWAFKNNIDPEIMNWNNWICKEKI